MQLKLHMLKDVKEIVKTENMDEKGKAKRGGKESRNSSLKMKILSFIHLHAIPNLYFLFIYFCSAEHKIRYKITFHD